jgi:hypothetical protein
MNTEWAETAEGARLIEARDKHLPWKLWGPYLSHMPELRDAVRATGPGHFGFAERGMIALVNQQHGAGIGASHPTGWTGVVANII